MAYSDLDPESPDARLRAALAIKAARYLAGGRVATKTQEKAGPVTTGELSDRTGETGNQIAKDRIEALEQIERKKPSPAARPWELATIAEALGGRKALLQALEPLIGPVLDAGSLAPNQTALQVRLDADGVEALAALLEGRRSVSQTDAAAAVDLLVHALRQGAQELQQQPGEQTQMPGGQGRPPRVLEADA